MSGGDQPRSDDANGGERGRRTGRSDDGGRENASSGPRYRSAAVVVVAWLVATSLLVGGGGLLVGSTPGDATDQRTTDRRGAVPRGPAGTVPLGYADVKLSGTAAEERAGWSVASAGDLNDDGVDDLLVGAQTDDEGGDNAGAVYVVFGPAERGSVSLADADAKLVGESEGDRAGFAVAAGDLNDDGVSDVVVGAPLDDDGGKNAGAAYVVYGGDSLSGTVPLAEADAKLVGAGARDRAGWSLATMANASTGSDDGETPGVLVGAPYADAGGADAGAAYLVAGESLDGPTELSPDNARSLDGAAATFVGESEGDHAGFAVAAGDVDGDSGADVVVGAPNASTTAPAAGAAYVVTNLRRSGTVDLGDANATLTGANEGDEAGFAVASGGDLDGDGTADVVVGAPYVDDEARDAGAAYVVYGGDLDGDRSLAAANVTLPGERAGDLAGWSVALPADANGDGFDDLLVGAPYEDEGGTDAGAAYLLYGSQLASTQELAGAHAKFVGESESDLAGFDAAGAGDANDDGAGDLFVAAPYDDSRETNVGAAYVVFGGAPPGETTATATPETTVTKTTTREEKPTEPKPGETKPTKTTPKPEPRPKTEPLDVTVAFDCTKATVTADQYTRVVLRFRDGSRQAFTGIYSGTNVFAGTAADEVITRIRVFDGPNSFKVVRNDVSGCVPKRTTGETTTTTTEKPPTTTTTKEEPPTTTTTTKEKPPTTTTATTTTKEGPPTTTTTTKEEPPTTTTTTTEKRPPTTTTTTTTKEEPPAENHIVVVGNADEPVRYDFVVEGDAEKTAESGDAPVPDGRITVSDEDRIEAISGGGSRVTGAVAGDADAYRFTGDVSRFRIELTATTLEKATIYMNGEAVQPAELGDSPAAGTPVTYLNCSAARVDGEFPEVRAHVSFVADDGGFATSLFSLDPASGTTLVHPTQFQDPPFGLDYVELYADPAGTDLRFRPFNPYAGPWCLEAPAETTATTATTTTTTTPATPTTRETTTTEERPPTTTTETTTPTETTTQTTTTETTTPTETTTQTTTTETTTETTTTVTAAEERVTEESPTTESTDVPEPEPTETAAAETEAVEPVETTEPAASEVTETATVASGDG
ncbi:integrin alpha [Halomicrococcus sp. SG-WS-1]|uniref:integrin alpha n=1 Tax=Halomicrococcus sp. SG-WS-1 TaxID=3439057 RepID=UPI003F7AD806